MTAYERLEQADTAEKDLPVSEPAETADVKGTAVSGTDTATKPGLTNLDIIRIIIAMIIAFNAFFGTLFLLVKLINGVESVLDSSNRMWVIYNCLGLVVLFVFTLYVVSYQQLGRFI